MKNEYDNLGYTKYKNYIADSFIIKINDTIDEMLKTIIINDEVFDEDKTGKIKQIQFLHKRHEIFIELLELVKPIIDELLDNKKYNILNMQLFEKHPLVSKPTRSHQDNAYFKQTPAIPLTIWIALDDIDENNGCLYYAPKLEKTTIKHDRYNPTTTFRLRSGGPWVIFMYTQP